MAQALTIRFGTDVSGAQRGMADLASAVAGNMAKISTTMLAAGRNVDQGLLATVARTTASVTAMQLALAGGVLVGFAGLGKAIADASEQLDRFVELGARASNLNLDVESYQRFVDALGGGKEALASLEKGLSAVKEKFDEISKVRSLLGEVFSSGYTGDFVSQGLRQFDSAADDKGRLRAAVVALREIQDLGLSLAATKLSEQLFSPEVAARIAQGKTDVSEILARMDGAKGVEIISAEDVRRAEELKDRIEKAKQAIADAVSASFSFAGAGEVVLKVWAGVLETVAKVAGVIKTFSTFQPANLVNQQITSLERQLQNSVGENPVRRRGMEEQLRKLQGQSMLQADANPAIPFGPDNYQSSLPVPKPPRQPPDIGSIRAGFAKKAGGGGGGSSGEGLDQIERFISQLERARDVAQAELDNIGKSNVEREKAIELAKAAAAARAAGRDLTEEERTKILQLAEAQQVLKNRIMDVRQAQAGAAEAMRFFGDAAADALCSIIFDGGKAKDVLRNLAKSFGKSGLQSLFTGQGPLASILGLAPKASDGPNAVGGLAGLLGSFFKAGGGDVTAGRAYTVGELGRELFVPSQNGTVMPIGRGGAGAAGGMTVSPTYHISVGGNVSQAELIAVRRQVEAAQRSLPRSVQTIMRQTELRGTRG